jgi:hypothetical protein
LVYLTGLKSAKVQINEPPNSRAGVLIHELSHAVPTDTGDVLGGDFPDQVEIQRAKDYAKGPTLFQPKGLPFVGGALKEGDNYKFYAEGLK